MNSMTLTLNARSQSCPDLTSADQAPVAGQSISGKVVAITGASSGIGAAAARLLAQQGAHVVLGARRGDRLATLAGEITVERGSARFRELDVTDRQDVLDFVDYAVAEFGRLDVIVNNAGVMALSDVAQGKVDDWNRMIDVNIRGVLHGIAAALPVMQAQGGGHVINLSAITGQTVSPSAAVYNATKAAVRAISAGLRQESEQVRVTVISPGATQSALANQIADPVLRAEIRALRAITIPAEAVAKAILFAIAQPAEVDVSEIVLRPTANPF
jgi:NADP-dependent 3-hydroxy acid dehydrogenase YdfG